MELNDVQKEIVETKEPKVVVIASAAAGKTACMAERLKYILTNGADPTKVVCITFTNAAADELTERVGTFKGLFIGTIHSYCNYLLRSSGHDTSKFLANEEFNRLFEEIKKYPDSVKPVDYLMLDESQDSNPQQFEFLLDIVKPTNYMLVGDYRQSIYRFNGAYPDFMINLAKEPDVKTYDLNKNYRNGNRILEYARSIINQAGYEYRDDSIPMSPSEGKVVVVDYSPTAVARTIAKYGSYGDWFVLCRKNAEVDEMCRALKAVNVPYDSFKRSQVDTAEFNKKMKENTVKVLTIHTSKGLEAKYVVVVGAKMFSIEEKCVSYVAATRAKELLVWTKETKKRKADVRIERWE